MSEVIVCPGDELRVLLPAGQIPNGSVVTKRTGEARMTLKQSLRVFSDEKGQAPLVVDGVFLISSTGSINQVKRDTLLLWVTTAEDFIDTLQTAWEPVPQ